MNLLRDSEFWHVALGGRGETAESHCHWQCVGLETVLLFQAAFITRV